MPETFTPARYATLTRTLCIVVLLVMGVAVLYTAWIAITNYSQIAV